MHLVDFLNEAQPLTSCFPITTRTEYKILWHLIKSAGKIVPNRTLLGQVWGRENLEDTHYLKVHIKHIRQKLGDQPAAPQYIFNERSVGYRFAKVAA